MHMSSKYIHIETVIKAKTNKQVKYETDVLGELLNYINE